MITERAYRQMQRAVLSQHFDANETLFLERELTQLRQKLFEVAYPEPVARMFAPKATDVASSAETYAFKVYRPTGVAELIAYKSGQIPRVDMTADEVLGKVRPIAAAYGWDINEMREAARMGLQLSEVKARTVRAAIERGIDELLAFGTLEDASLNRADVGLNGLVNNTLVETQTVLDNTHWLDGGDDPDLILAEMTACCVAVSNQSENIFTADTLLMSLPHYNYVMQTPWSALTGESILTIFRKNMPQVKTIAPWHKLTHVSTAQGGTAKPRMIAYQKAPDCLEAVIPQEFEQMPPEQRGLELIVNCHARCGGVKIYQPLAFKYADHATS